MTVTNGATPPNRVSGFEFAVSPDVRALAAMRREVAARLAPYEISAQSIGNLVTVLSELCTNAIEASKPATEPVLVRVQLAGDTVAIEAENVGDAYPDDPGESEGQAGTDAERGRGLFIVRHFAEEVTFTHRDGRCTVAATMPLR